MGLFGLKIYLKAKNISKNAGHSSHRTIATFNSPQNRGFQVNCSTILQAPFKQYNMEMR